MRSCFPGGVRGVDGAEDLGGPGGAVRRRELVRPEARDVEAGHVHVGPPRGDPVRQDPAQPARGQDADRVHPGGHEVAADAGRLAHRRGEVGGERLGPAEERADPDLVGDRHPVHRLLEERRHPVPVGRQRPEGEVPRDARDRPGRGLRLEEADHHPAPFLAVVAEGGRVLEDRRVLSEALDGVGDQVVVLGGLVGDHQPVALPELTRPHAGAVDDVLALDHRPVRRSAPGRPRRRRRRWPRPPRR